MNNKIIGLYVEIISQCNEHCKYCYNENILEYNNHLDFESFKKIVVEGKELGGMSIVLSGGEPLLHKDLIRFVGFVVSQNMHITIVTNLTVYNEELYRYLCSQPVFLQVTLDGPTEQVHDYTRGKGTYQKVVNNLRRLIELGAKERIQLRMNLHKKNWMYVEDVVALAEQLNILYLYLALINPVGRGKEFDKYIIHNHEEDILLEIQSKIAVIKPRYSCEIKFEGLKESIGCPYYGHDNVQCGIRISPRGDVYPCQLFTDDIFCIGNVRNLALTDIINGNDMNDFLKLMSLRKKYIPECNGCTYKCICNSGCPGEAYNLKGNIFATNDKCTRNIKLFKKYIKDILKENRS